jgi:hypothetical protein
VPGVSFNADPNTGYVVFYTSDVHRCEVQTFTGGTSFVAPKLNGITALLVQNADHRLGFLNPTLYGLARDKYFDEIRGPPALPATSNFSNICGEVIRGSSSACRLTGGTVGSHLLSRKVPERAVACKQTVNHRWAAATVGGRQTLEMPRHEPHPKIRTVAPKPPPDNKLERRCAITSAQS